LFQNAKSVVRCSLSDVIFQLKQQQQQQESTKDKRLLSNNNNNNNKNRLKIKDYFATFHFFMLKY